MMIYPAIDLRGGKVVRLREGDPNQQTIYSDDPLMTAQRWREQGATWVHIVNLDGAFSQANDNNRVLRAVRNLGLKVQFGGGLRSLADISEALNSGASRVVLGTLAIQQPDIVSQCVAVFGAHRICVALDARDGKVTTHGWTEVSDETPIGVGRAMAARGLKHALYTDVSRDGMLSGANIQATVDLAEATGLRVIASGGIHSLKEIEALTASGVVAGVVIGTALYKQEIQLADAIKIAEGPSV